MFTECFYFLHHRSVSCNCRLRDRGVIIILTASTRDGSRSNMAANLLAIVQMVVLPLVSGTVIKGSVIWMVSPRSGLTNS